MTFFRFFFTKQYVLIYDGLNVDYHYAIYEINNQKYNENTNKFK